METVTVFSNMPLLAAFETLNISSRRPFTFTTSFWALLGKMPWDFAIVLLVGGGPEQVVTDRRTD